VYPFIRLALGQVRAWRQGPLPPDAVHVSRHTCLPWDLDMFMEMNNGRVLSFFDLGRFELAQRGGLIRALVKNRWTLAVAGSTVRYRRRILAFRRYEMRSAAIGRDNRFIYIQQSVWRDGQCHASIVMRTAALERGKAVDTDRIVTALGLPGWNPPLPEWIDAWRASEDLRIWPPEI